MEVDPKELNDFNQLSPSAQNFLIYAEVKKIGPLQDRVLSLERWQLKLHTAWGTVLGFLSIVEGYIHIKKH